MISDAVEISILTADSSHKGVHLFHEGWEQLGGGFLFRPFKGTTPPPPPLSPMTHTKHKLICIWYKTILKVVRKVTLVDFFHMDLPCHLQTQC